jgi:hypothetical protein
LRSDQTRTDEVLAAGARLERVGVLGGVLEALDEVDGVLADVERVLAGGLDVAPPACEEGWG